MRRSTFLALLLVAAIGSVTAQPAAAITIRRNNPFRSFNTSGVNYGSMRWEKTHRHSAPPSSTRARAWRR